MANDSVMAIFANFNDITEAPPVIAEAGPSQADLLDIRTEAWTDGFLAGQRGGTAAPDRTASLLTAVHALKAAAEDASETAALSLADLFVKALLTATDESWSAMLGERVRKVAARIKPVLTNTPDYLIRDVHGEEHHFTDISALCRALDDGLPGNDVTISWQHGQAFIGREAFLHDLRDAFTPLSTGRSTTA